MRAHRFLCVATCAAVMLLLSCSDTADEATGSADFDFVGFVDPNASEVMRTVVYDATGDRFSFDRLSNSIIWEADSSAHAGWPALEGNRVGSTAFRIRFGTEAGEARAYFTETVSETLCDLVVTNGSLQVFPTELPVPKS